MVEKATGMQENEMHGIPKGWGKSAFKGARHGCGENGHRLADCPKNGPKMRASNPVGEAPEEDHSREDEDDFENGDGASWPPSRPAERPQDFQFPPRTVGRYWAPTTMTTTSPVPFPIPQLAEPNMSPLY